jgi:exosortase K
MIEKSPNTGWTRGAQLLIVLLFAIALKVHYSTANANELRWVLAPTAAMVELTTGTQFEFESYAGYMSEDRTFLIAASCSGVNFLITAFLMLSLGSLWQVRPSGIRWRSLVAFGVITYITTIIANTVRVSAALNLGGISDQSTWLSPGQLHRLEGISVYFGFLLLLFVAAERTSWRGAADRHDVDLFPRSFFALLIYYATTLGLPLANGAYTQGAPFWEHAAFVMIIPVLMVMLLVILQIGARSITGWASACRRIIRATTT